MTSDMALPRWLEHRSTILCSRAMGIRLVLGNPRTALLRAQAARWRPALALKCADAQLRKSSRSSFSTAETGSLACSISASARMAIAHELPTRSLNCARTSSMS